MPASRRRTATKLLRLHPDELARITARAEACGLNTARFIRETALGAVRKARHHADTDRLLHALARLGARLEHAMRHVRSTGDAQLAELFAEIRNDHRALLAEVLALRAPDHPAITVNRETPGASPNRMRSCLPRNGQGEPSTDQLTIDFHLGGPPAAVRRLAVIPRRHALASTAT